MIWGIAYENIIMYYSIKLKYRAITKKIYIPKFEHLAIIPFKETGGNFGLKYFEVCAQELYEKQELNSNSYEYSDRMLNISNSNT